LDILFYGKTNESVSLEINRNGAVDFPQLGPVNLTGMTFADAKALLQERIAEEMLGVQASISLGELRSIQVFVLGEAYKPGAYTVSALSTITNALFLSGGVSDIASLRNIQLKRAGKTIASLDLYELLLDGDTSNDQRLQASDVIYIPTVGNTASVDGEVKRPAIYELKGTTTVKQLVAMAGGMQATAYPNRATIQRSDTDGFMTVVDLDLTHSAGLTERVANGDLLIIDSVVERKEAVVTLSGHVYRPGEFRWKSGLRVSDLVKDVRQLRPDGDLDFALIRREVPPIGRVTPVFVNLGAALESRGGEADIAVDPRDELTIFSREEGRAEILEDLVDELKLQARSGKMANVVSITGTVRSPGEYPLTENMTVTQLIAAAGGLEEAAYTSGVEVSRYDLSNPEQASSAHFPVDLSEAYADASADILLQSYDVLSVRTIPEFRESLSVTLEGELRFPGDYSFTRGETLGDVIRRAGGLNRLAHPEAAVFTREDLRLQEAKKLEQIQERLEADIAAAGLENANDGAAKGTTAAADKLLETLDATEAVGRLVIDLEGIMDGRLEDVQLKDGDALVIPEYRQEISVLGEVQQPTAHLYNSDLRLRDYLDLSGGTKESADKKRIYVIKANGAVALPGGSGWLSRKSVNIEAGDTIVVPIDADKQKTLTVWAEATQIIYQLALGAAAFNNLSN
jgi:protein involved in polysaccharide export with SLBB domain